MKDTSCGSWWIQSLALWRHQKTRQDNVLKISDSWLDNLTLAQFSQSKSSSMPPCTNRFVIFFFGNETFADKQLPPHLPWHRWLFNWQHVMRLVRSWNQQLLWHALLLRQVEVVLERDDDEYLSWQSESSSVLLTCNSSGEEWEEATRSVKGHMRHLAYWTSQSSCWSREAKVFHQSFPFYHVRLWLMLFVNVWTCFAKMPGNSTKGVK